MTVQVFGKFDLHAQLPLRGFEVYFGITSREGPQAWRSSYASVQNLLNHLARYTRSYSSREKYLDVLRRFCQGSGYNPDELVRLSKENLSTMVQGFADQLASRDRSRAYVNSVIKRLRTFFRVNGYTHQKGLTVSTYFVPARYRKKPEYIPSKDEVLVMVAAAGSPRNRALILTLWSSGLRVSTLTALNYRDVAQELNNNTSCVMVQVYSEMKLRVADACKGNIPYYTFICSEAVSALKPYLREREEKYGPISQDDPLFHSEWNLWNSDERSRKRLNRRTIAKIVRKAARLAGISQWKHVTPHCLRKSFESVLRSPTIDGGRLDKGTQEFLFGHILPGSQDAYYDKTKTEFHRAEYMKLDFYERGFGGSWADAVLAAVRIASAGLEEDPESIVNKYVGERYGGEVPWKLWPEAKQLELVKKALEWRRSQQPKKEYQPIDKVIKSEVLELYLNRGWIFVAQLGNQKVVVRRLRTKGRN